MGCGASANSKYKQGQQAPAADGAAPAASAEAAPAGAEAAPAAAAAGEPVAPPAPTAGAGEVGDEAEQAAAATRIQAVYRGQKSRAEIAPHEAAPAAAAGAAGEAAAPATLEGRKSQEQQEEEAAVRIQSVVRGNRQRAGGKKKEGAAAKGEGEDGDEEEEEEEDDVMDDAEFEKNMKKRGSIGPRKGVSAEHTEVDENWKAPIFEKTEEQEARLRTALSKSFMFAALEQEQLAVVVAAFRETPAEAGNKVIEQGAQVVGDAPALYVIESGTLSVFKKGLEKAVFVYDTPGQYFGDLALLYNAPRAATVVADTESQLWSIDRETFNRLVKDAAKSMMERRMGFLKDVPLLAGLTEGERAHLCDAIQSRVVEAGTHVITEGESGVDLFIVEAGKCEARKGGEVMCQYEAKDYFGELALLREMPRAADIVAVEASQLLVLGAEAFSRLLGPLDAILKERAGQYDQMVIEAANRVSEGGGEAPAGGD